MRPKLSKEERKANNRQKAADALAGTGLHVFENNVKGDLSLPKPTASGKRSLTKNEQFQGDSYFFNLVRSGLLRFIRTISEVGPNDIKEETMSQEKLILDQPDTVTTEGKVEHVVEKKPEVLAEQKGKKDEPVLLTEGPVGFIEIE